MSDSWLLYLYAGLMYLVDRQNDPDASFINVTIPEGGFEGMLNALRNNLALTNVSFKKAIEGTASAAYYQLVLAFFQQYGLGLPGSPDDKRGEDEDTIGYEELVKPLPVGRRWNKLPRLASTSSLIMVSQFLLPPETGSIQDHKRFLTYEKDDRVFAEYFCNRRTSYS